MKQREISAYNIKVALREIDEDAYLETVFEIAEKEKPLSLVCDFYLNIADQLLTQPEGVVPTELPDQELFRLLSNTTSKSTETKSNLDFMLV